MPLKKKGGDKEPIGTLTLITEVKFWNLKIDGSKREVEVPFTGVSVGALTKDQAEEVVRRAREIAVALFSRLLGSDPVARMRIDHVLVTAPKKQAFPSNILDGIKWFAAKFRFW